MSKYDLPSEDKISFLDEQDHAARGAYYRAEMDSRKIKKLMKSKRFKDNGNAQLQFGSKLEEYTIQREEIEAILDIIDEMKSEA